MKTVKTANGVREIDDRDWHLISLQLRTILQEHRTALVNKLIAGGLAPYIDYRFAIKVQPKQLEQIILALEVLRHEGIDVGTYGVIFETVLRSDFTALDNALFYMEIDKTINAILLQSQSFSEIQYTFFQ
jgi:hypothetical protein